MNRSILRTLALLILCVFLASSMATAAPRPRSESFPAQTADDLVGWLGSTVRLLWSKAGCQVDPFGLCVKNGCQLDPNGACVKNGCQLDPFGRCLDTTTSTPVNTKNGCQIDPYGRCIS